MKRTTSQFIRKLMGVGRSLNIAMKYLQDLRSSAKMLMIYIYYVIFRISCFTCFVHLRDECSNEQSSLVLNHFEKGRVGQSFVAHRGATAKIVERSTQK